VNVENGSWGNIRCSYSTVSGIGSHFSSVRICVYFKTASHLVLSYPCPDMKALNVLCHKHKHFKVAPSLLPEISFEFHSPSGESKS